ncbi:MAG: hypothetical protein QOF53_1454 [Nocardioidaceae bacterium]|nr:hypothetical protein [Nocardioidaceae bacterium]
MLHVSATRRVCTSRPPRPGASAGLDPLDPARLHVSAGASSEPLSSPAGVLRAHRSSSPRPRSPPARRVGDDLADRARGDAVPRASEIDARSRRLTSFGNQIEVRGATGLGRTPPSSQLSGGDRPCPWSAPRGGVERGLDWTARDGGTAETAHRRSGGRSREPPTLPERPAAIFTFCLGPWGILWSDGQIPNCETRQSG